MQARIKLQPAAVHVNDVTMAMQGAMELLNWIETHDWNDEEHPRVSSATITSVEMTNANALLLTMSDGSKFDILVTRYKNEARNV